MAHLNCLDGLQRHYLLLRSLRQRGLISIKSLRSLRSHERSLQSLCFDFRVIAEITVITFSITPTARIDFHKIAEIVEITRTIAAIPVL